MLYKNTDTGRYISFNSCQPKQCKNNIPFTPARRICTIVENSADRKKRLNELQKVFMFPRITTKFIQKAIPKATSISIENLRISEAKADNNNLTFVTTFHPNNKSVFSLIQDMTCDSCDLVHVVTCNEEFIGETAEGKTGFHTEFEIIGNTSVNRNSSNLNTRNTFELVEKENSKYSLFSNYIHRINI